MNSIAVMQPYFFPYIGYFQLVSAVDKFIFYDDVDFIKNGWINRNRILINGEPKYFTVPCKNVSSNAKIKGIEHGLNHRIVNKLLKKIKFTYSKAPYYKEVYAIVEKVFCKETKYISELAIHSIKKSSKYLGLNCIFLKSSEEYENEGLNAAQRLIDICKTEDAENYINSAGGKELYDKSNFRRNEIELYFLEPQEIQYEQFGDEFVPWLSIIDIMMFNSPQKIKANFLESYKLV